ncbi:MAG TPA: hypothetical protein VNG93_07225 [Candidatus Dormibacteraeota bacterium]|nr:hypothetical protein [Candidatus Dormibacteraeota bacterium]
MNADFALLAEYAAAPPDGKLYIVGGAVRRMASPAFPTAIPVMSLIVSLRVPPAECDQDQLLQITYLDPDGHAIIALPPVTIRAARNADSRTSPAFVNLVWSVQGLPVPGPGEYAFSVVWAGQELASVGFRAVVAQAQPQGPPQAAIPT